MKPLSDHVFRRISAIAREEAGLHLPVSKHVFVRSRLQRRLRANNLATFDDYLSLLEGHGPAAIEERRSLVSALTTNVTHVFREPHHFRILGEHLRNLVKQDARRGIRIWSAGCSTGLEPLSIAATCAANLGPDWKQQITILATDIDASALQTASDHTDDADLCDSLRSGPPSVTPWALPGHATLASLQSAVTYMRHNLLTQLPGREKFDVIFCRNVLIYFARDVQIQVQDNLRRRLDENGLIFFGHSERLHFNRDQFVSVGPTAFQNQDDRKGLVTWH